MELIIMLLAGAFSGLAVGFGVGSWLVGLFSGLAVFFILGILCD